VSVPHSSWDERSRSYRALAIDYRDIINYLKSSKIEYQDRVLDPLPFPSFLPKIKLRDYQKKALEAWKLAERRGIIVLPTGSGKTIVGMKAIAEVKESTLVVVPTLDLVDQWRNALQKKFKIQVGSYCGGEHILGPITVATYDTAYLRAGELGNRFPFVIFDEVHHLPAPGYSSIAEMLAAPFRLGLTATYERENGLHKELPRLVGGKVYELGVDELSGKHLAEYELKVIPTSLLKEEMEIYRKNYNKYLAYLRSHRIKIRTQKDFQLFVLRTGRDPKARKALLARHQARMVALNSEAKIDALKEILELHSSDRILIFTEHNELVHRISSRFLIPFITHKTRKEERRMTLERFRSGKYKAVVTSKVLDEGIDVPEANVGIILSGSGSTREYRQRLGRILRRKEGKKAILYEIFSKQTSEVSTSRRRHLPVEYKLKLRRGEKKKNAPIRLSRK
jgi:superfamily II DNA or RNA helicase